jgi:predicted DNA binding protein
MNKMNFLAFKRTIATNIANYPLTLIYERTTEPYESSRMEEYKDYLGETVNIGSWSRTQQKYSFIYTVIFSKLYFDDEGKRLKVSDAEIQNTFNKFGRTLEVLNSQEYLNEFHAYLFQEAKKVLELEKREQQAYNKKHLLRKLLDNDSMLHLQMRVIQKTSDKLKEIDSKMYALINDWKHRKITAIELDYERNRLDEAREYYRDLLDHLVAKYKSKSESGHYRRRKNLKSCFNHSDLYNPKHDEQPEILERNLSTVTFMLEEYCRWYNERFADEINSSKTNVTPRNLEHMRRISLLTPYLRSDLSIANIAEQTGISKSAVQRILSQLRKSN